jgi:hypothetical protein
MSLPLFPFHQDTPSLLLHANAANCVYRYLDPLFAIAIGISAASVRIRREEKEQGRSTEEIITTFRQRALYSFGLEKEQAAKVDGGKA